MAPLPHSGPIYLYLTQPEWAAAWIDGGEVPLGRASAYLSQERAGTKTPDELRQLVCDGADVGILSKVFGSGLRNATIEGGTFIGYDDANPLSILTVERAIYSNYTEDALILCAACKASRAIQTRLNKAACVRIDDVAALKATFDEQLGVQSDAGRVGYTDDSERAHFLKSTADAWQHEYRFSWAIRPLAERRVIVPAGTAELVEFN